MSREESLIIKGVAILLMLFYHLFNRSDYVDMCQSIMYIGDTPLVHILTKAANPVAFFIMLSGYGLYISHNKGPYNVWQKVKKLYIHYWITLMIFVPIGFFVIGSYKYLGNLNNIIGNIIGWNVSYNGEIWFLLPYTILMLGSSFIIKILDMRSPKLCIVVSFIISLGCGWLIPRNDLVFIHICLLVGTFLGAFTLGVYMSKYQIFNGGVN